MRLVCMTVIAVVALALGIASLVIAEQNTAQILNLQTTTAALALTSKPAACDAFKQPVSCTAADWTGVVKDLFSPDEFMLCTISLHRSRSAWPAPCDA